MQKLVIGCAMSLAAYARHRKGKFMEQFESFGESCTALVLSGGGSNGAWEAGVIWGLMNYGDTT